MIAWYTQSQNLNPFKKYRIQRNKVSQVEDGTMQAQPAEDVGGQPRLPTAMGILMASGTDGQASVRPEPDTEQVIPANPTASTQDADKPEAAPHPPDHDSAEKGPGDAEDPLKERDPQFTFAGQLRSALFNSWINLLLVAVPAGRKPPFFSRPCSFRLCSDLKTI